MRHRHEPSRGRRATPILLVLLALALVFGVPAALGASTPVLVKDVAPAGGSSPHGLVVAGGNLFFGASDGTNGTELWRSDGAGAGTTMVKDINPGGDGVPGVFSVAWSVAVGSTLYFQGNDGVHGWELWKSDGTAPGTVMVKDINPSGDSSPVLFTIVGSTVFFVANDGTNGFEVWKTDGTDPGTVMVKNIDPNTGGAGGAGSLIAYNGALYFVEADGVNGAELWRSDGTAPGTVMVKDICPGSCSSSPDQLAVSNGTLFFRANDGTAGSELWRSDGTGTGTTMVSDIVPGASSSDPINLTDVNGTLFFTAFTTAAGSELWKSDGSDAGTVLVKDIRSGSGSSTPSKLANVGGTLFFRADDGVHGAELWKSDGTDGGTVIVKDINNWNLISDSSSPDQLTSFAGNVYFWADDGHDGIELWKSDGSTSGTTMVMNIASGGNSSSPGYFNPLAILGGTLFFTADDVTHGAELWKITTAVAAPTVSSFTPSSGGPGTSVGITGANFTGATAVTFGGTAAQSFTVDSDTHITAVVAAGTANGPVAVTNPLGTGTSAGTFTFIAAPTISGFNPPSAGVHATVTVTGTGFGGATSVRLNGTSAAFAVVSATQLTFTVPTGATSGTITVTTAGGTGTSGGSFTIAPPPTVTSISPGVGPVGTRVTITGTNLDGTVGVMLGSVITVPTSTSPTSVTFAIPPGAASGHVKVLTTSGSATSTDTFTVTG